MNWPEWLLECTPAGGGCACARTGVANPTSATAVSSARTAACIGTPPLAGGIAPPSGSHCRASHIQVLADGVLDAEPVLAGVVLALSEPAPEAGGLTLSFLAASLYFSLR